MTNLDLLDNDLQDDLRSTLRGWLASRYEPADVSVLYDGDRSLVQRLWKELAADLGLTGLLIPEEQGGAGASAREAAVVLEELARAIAPVPYLTSAVVATSALLNTETTLLPALAAGDTCAALAVPFGTTSYRLPNALQLNDDGSITGEIRGVAGAIEADMLLVLATDGTEVGLYEVQAEGVDLTPIVCLDMTRQLADVRMSGVPATRVAQDGASAASRGLVVGAALLASEQVGLSQWCLETTIAFLKDRRQFGRVVGSYQALKHRLADLYAEVESPSAAARYAAAAVAESDPDVDVATAVAQAYCSDVAVHAAEAAVQLHGGLGMTWEHPVHLYLKRAKSDQVGLGDAGMHRKHLAELINLPVGRS